MTAIPPRDQNEQKPLRVRYGRVDSVDLYEIKDVELELLERGAPADIQLNFAIFLFSLSFSGLATLFTATFKYAIAQIIFVVVVVVGLLLGSFLFMVWRRSRKSVRELCVTIRSRIPAEPAQPSAPPSGVGGTSDPYQPSG